MEETIREFKNRNILVIGDSILDATIKAEVIGISLESPTLKAHEKSKEYSYGGAFNVVNNILALEAKCTFVTLVGDDEYRVTLENYSHPNLTFVPLYEKGYTNVVKSRYWVERGDSTYKYFQLNRSGDTVQLSKSNEAIISNIIRENYDRVVIVDYNGGLLSNSVASLIVDKSTAPVMVSSQMSDRTPNHPTYKGAELICMNSDETLANCQMLCAQPTDLPQIFDSAICITRGDKGSTLFMNEKAYSSRAFSVNAVDACGAGDSFLAMLSLTDYTTKPQISLQLSNVWAALATTHVGTQTPDYESFLSHANHLL